MADILAGDDPQVVAVLTVINAARADVLALQGIDWDLDLAALGALNTRLDRPYAHLFARQPNTGVPTGLDMDGDGRKGRARDAQGYGRFAGQSGMAVLSRLPFDPATVADFTSLLWRDLPGATLPKTATGAAFPSDAALAAQRLSTTAHWAIPLITGSGTLTLLTFHATPPVFDGPEDRNGLRNADEIGLWRAYLDGDLTGTKPQGPFVLAGDANLDGSDGDGRRSAINALLEDPRFRDARPASRGAVDASKSQGGANRDHKGPAALDTVDWFDDPGPGNMRVDYVLPSADLRVTGSGVLWPEDADSALAQAVRTASRHRLVWLDLDL